MFGNRVLFRDREDAANKLAARLLESKLENPVVLGIPRGGMPIGAVVAKALGAPFSVFVSRKIGAPGNPEFGIGAVAEDGSYLLDDESVAWTGASRASLEASIEAERARCRAYVERYRNGQPLPALEGRTAVLCDDGLATGITMLAAVAAVQKLGAAAVVAAAPVASRQAVARLRGAGAQPVAYDTPHDFGAVAQFYERFEQLSDDDVARFLRSSVL